MADNTPQEQQGNIRAEYNVATTGMNMDNTVNQVPKGMLTYALNAAVENFDANSVNYQNESGNEFCLQFPSGYVLIGRHFIIEQNKHIFFLTNAETGDSEIGQMINNDCIYRTIVNAKCLNFNINHPIHKVVHKITNCTTEIYWTDGYNSRRYLDLDNIPYKLSVNTTLCDPSYTNELDCNQLKIQPNFSIPQLAVTDVISGGDLTAGTYQFAIQYSDAAGNGYSSYYSVTNPTPIANIQLTTPNFNYQVGKSIVLNINNLDVTGQWQYYNLAVIKTVNNIPSVELVGTYFIEGTDRQITYTGQNVTQIKLTINDIFEKYPYYDIAQDLTAVQDILVWDNLTSIDRINYQQIANQVTLGWETWRIPATENYADEINATNLRGYLRDEVYAFEIVFLLRNGKQTDGFHIPGRISTVNDITPVSQTNDDFIGEPDPLTTTSPYWKIYNTASITGFSPNFSPDSAYKGPYQYGEFAYWESTEKYPCNKDVWGDLANQPIRHHKFPDVLVSPIFESKIFAGAAGMVMGNDAVFPIGVRIDVQQIKTLIDSSSLTQEQKDDIVGFKIVRGDRSTNKSIVAKGILRNVGKYVREDQTYYYPNYPYNDLKEDPFLVDKPNSYTVQTTPEQLIGVCRNFNVRVVELQLDSASNTNLATIEYLDCYTNQIVTKTFTTAGIDFQFCAANIPVFKAGKGIIKSLAYKLYKIKLTGTDPTDNIKVGYVPPEGLCGWDLRNGTINGPFSTPPPAGYATWYDWCIVPGNAPLGGQNCCYGLSETINSLAIPGTFTAQSILPSIVKPYITEDDAHGNYTIEEYASVGDFTTCAPKQLDAFNTDDSKYRMVFNSPETSFGQPFLGNVLKLENVMFGAGKAHFTQVKKNALYKLITLEAQQDAMKSSNAIGNITGTCNILAAFAAYQAYLEIYINGITRRNYAYSFNSIADYNYSNIVDNNLGIKQRSLDVAQYLIPGVQSVGDANGISINNWYRESSVYLKTVDNRPPLPFAQNTQSMVTTPVIDNSRFVASDSQRTSCNNYGQEVPINVVSYYASLKNIFVNQWGQIYSYNTIDTGFQWNFNVPSTTTVFTIFGGDTFISRFAFKTKLPFFIDWRVNAPDDSDIFFDEIGNVAYPKYWHSARSVLSNAVVCGTALKNFFSVKAHNFDCPSQQTPADSPTRTYYDGKMYLFAYGVPNFYCESSINTDLRQAFNNKEGDFWPHVSTGIPDDWVQESNVTIAQDNTYYYNVTYSKQNKENFFSHLPPDWTAQLCYTNYPFRAIYSDTAVQNADNRVNNWLIYRATSMFDFPQNYGKLVSLDGIQNKAVLARFENKSLLYNTMLTVATSNPQAAYLGNDTLFKAAPPIDFAETDLGYVGSQNKMLLKIPQGQVTVDAKRGQVFLIAGNQATDLSAFGSGLNRFFTDHLAFEILRYFPKVNIDNHFNGIGLHGVYDSKFDRVIITKLDYIPLDKNIKYDENTQTYYLEQSINDVPFRTQVYLTDEEFFCNKSWTLSFNMNTKSWISFHSYLPNFYIGESNFFYSGLNGCCDALGGSVGTEAIVATINKELTTTSSTTIPPFVIPTYPTPVLPDCGLDGVIALTDCGLEGVAEITIPPTTTTTICQRPGDLISYFFYDGYQIGVAPPVISSGSLADACAAIATTSDGCAVLNGFVVNALNLDIGTTLYYGVGSDCTLVPDGWYFTEGSAYFGYVYHVVGGILVEIVSCLAPSTTTTTTTTPPCKCYVVEVVGTVVVSWLDCLGAPNVLTVTNDTLYICAIRDSIEAIPTPGNYVNIIGGCDDCTGDGDCTTTTTTTTI